MQKNLTLANHNHLKMKIKIKIIVAFLIFFQNRLTSKAIKMDVNHVEYLFIGFDYLPSVLAMLLMSFTITSCGSLSLCLCTLYYVLKVTSDFF